MSKYILGGGLVGLLAKEILGDEWDIIPQGASRFYGYRPALADNFITVSDKTDKRYIGDIGSGIIRRSFSLAGDLNCAPHQWLYDMYLEKVYGDGYEHFQTATPIEQAVSTTAANDLYHNLLEKHKATLVEKVNEHGKVQKIKDGKIITDLAEIPYDKIVSTVPLDAVHRFLDWPNVLPARDAWVYHIKTDKINLEGAHQVFVLDEVFDFYKVNQVGRFDFLFFCLNEVLTPMEYFGAFTEHHLEVIGPGVKLNSFIPLQPNSIDRATLGEHNITCVGSYAEWDDCVDIGSSIIRLQKLRI